MRWTKCSIHVKPMVVDALANSLLEMGIEGIEIDDQLLTEADKEAMFVNYVDEAIVPREEHRVIVYLDETQDVEAIKQLIINELERLKNFFDLGSGQVLCEVMPEEDYENKWKEFYEPFRVGERIVITPLWIEPEVKEGDLLIRIDPGMAFGSGTHETTYLCIEQLNLLDLHEKKVIDVGCGSAILGIAAAKLGAREVLGIDIDPNAVTIGRENVISNGLQDVMTVIEGNLVDHVKGQVDVVVANILADVILLIAQEVKNILLEGGVFIASGILDSRAEEVVTALQTLGYIDVETFERGEWVAIKAKVPYA